MKTSPRRPQQALTLIEVLIIICSLVVLTALLLPALAPRHHPARQVYCVSNLKQIGLGWHTWIHDHESRELPFRVPVAKGGTFGAADPLKNEAWWQHLIISNELASPKVLVCPSDKNVGLSRLVADNWSSTDPRGGFATVGVRNRSTSYIVGLDASQPRAGNEWEPSDRILGGDRNIQFDGHNGNCSSGVGEAQLIRAKGPTGQNASTARWTNAIHGERGNVLSLDGGVRQTTSKEFNALSDLSNDAGVSHFLAPN